MAWTVLLGWFGVIAILVAYALMSFEFLKAQSYWYQGLSAFGGFCIVITALAKQDWPPFALNAIWCAIAFAAIARIWYLRRNCK